MHLKEVKQMDKVIPKFKNEIKNNTHILTLNGVVASDEFDNTISSKFVQNSLNGTDKDIVIKLASGGGDAFEGINIYNYLKSLKNHVTVEITSIAASAASIIAMGADKIVMHTGANMMIHEASLMAFGDKSTLQKALNAVESANKSIVEIYHERTGIDKTELSRMMANETWFTADEAVMQKFADEKYSKKEVTNMDKKQLVASLKEQQKLLAQMISNVNEESQPPDEPDNKDTLEERVTKVENDIKNIETRLNQLERKSENDKESLQQPQNKFNKFAF
ncbi:Clp protease ClpP [Staphylococcus felis]|uniref:Clp protease ClpP n=2 Tax=Staphylococcus felis TaxID=46127 RepID=A0AAX1RVX7_9STAP|nr:Clp protease ClpP [Staphylococcus felis]REH83881.1 Clp protease ClpP [Staphylococcus felis]REH85285.1 Clp protease ClpP [Staphylococcus felis]REH99021.1 Clp protease ClpP [Staphylococcus felis]REI15421.1 Clp protease ClpP [Staphylococcus felis]